MKGKRKIALLVLFVIFLVGCSSVQEKNAGKQTPTVAPTATPKSQRMKILEEKKKDPLQHQVHMEEIKEGAEEYKKKNEMLQYFRKQYVLDIILPEGYNTNKKYPVVYITDGNWRREDVKDLRNLCKKREIQDVIYVLICYPDDFDIDNVRVDEFIDRPEKTLDIYVNEIIPYIEKNYSVDKKNTTLWGSSCGGYFATYCFLQSDQITKGVFKNYIMASPTFDCFTREISLLDMEDVFIKKVPDVSVNIYMSVGEKEEREEYIEPLKEFVKILKQKNYSGLNISYKVDQGKDHYTVWKPALIHGLKQFLKPVK